MITGPNSQKPTQDKEAALEDFYILVRSTSAPQSAASVTSEGKGSSKTTNNWLTWRVLKGPFNEKEILDMLRILQNPQPSEQDDRLALAERQQQSKHDSGNGGRSLEQLQNRMARRRHWKVAKTSERQKGPPRRRRRGRGGKCGASHAQKSKTLAMEQAVTAVVETGKKKNRVYLKKKEPKEEEEKKAAESGLEESCEAEAKMPACALAIAYIKPSTVACNVTAGAVDDTAADEMNTAANEVAKVGASGMCMGKWRMAMGDAGLSFLFDTFEADVRR